ncbi:hypothetical protein AOLI_G00169030 [Acnodon oligacanthus]
MRLISRTKYARKFAVQLLAPLAKLASTLPPCVLTNPHRLPTFTRAHIHTHTRSEGSAAETDGEAQWNTSLSGFSLLAPRTAAFIQHESAARNIQSGLTLEEDSNTELTAHSAGESR